MHQATRTNHFPSINISHALMSKTDAKNGKTTGKTADHFIADSCLLGSTWPRRNTDPIRIHGIDFGNRDLIIATNERFCSQFSKILDDIVGEGIVVIDDEDHGRICCGRVAEASSMARITPMALLTVSSNSAAGLESATIPAPACT